MSIVAAILAELVTVFMARGSLIPGLDRHTDRGDIGLGTVVPMSGCKTVAVRSAEEAAAKVQNDRTQRQEAAIQKWRAAPAETGNRAFFQLGVDLRGAGLGMAEIEDVLRQETTYALLPAKRRDQIKYIMRTLRGSSRQMAA